MQLSGNVFLLIPLSSARRPYPRLNRSSLSANSTIAWLMACISAERVIELTPATLAPLTATLA